MILVSEFAEESLAEYGTFLDPEKLKETFDQMYKTSFVAVVDDKVVGILGGRIIQDICSKLPIYEEIVWYVSKEHRKYGIKLFRHAEQWCRDNKISRISMSCMCNSKTEKLLSLYEKLGFVPMEIRCVKEIE
jgi:GNAT superfamily N-acetyltransferase